MAEQPVMEQSSLFVRPKAGAGGRVFWGAQWRYRVGSGEWRQKTRRLGPAWQEPDGDGGWRKRRGRCPDGRLDERAANAAAVAVMEAHAQEVGNEQRAKREAAQRKITVRDLGQEWFEWLEEVRGAKPSTIRDYACLLRDPGIAYKRGDRKTAGRIMAAFGDRPYDSVRTAGPTPTTWQLTRYREPASDGRGRPPQLDYYEVEEVEALARVCERGEHRPTPAVAEGEIEARKAEDRQDADAFRILFYTGIRVGELETLRWADVDLDARTLLVRRNLSAGVETDPKGRRHRYVPMPDPVLAALARLGARDEFSTDEDYVICNRWGRRLGVSALRRRYQMGCKVAGLRRVKLHGLLHAAGSILARVADPVFVRDGCASPSSPTCVRLERPSAYYRVIGKGRKTRSQTLTTETVQVLRDWFHERQGTPEDPVFPTRRGEPLTPRGVAWLIDKHTTTATIHTPSLATKRVTP